MNHSQKAAFSIPGGREKERALKHIKRDAAAGAAAPTPSSFETTTPCDHVKAMSLSLHQSALQKAVVD